MTHDFVIAGGGAAGCVLAARLSECPDTTVLLLEAGEKLRGIPGRIPALRQTMGAGIDWAYEVEPDETRGGTVDRWNNGRALGGGSATNYMVWVRGSATDYDGWEALGCAGWGYEDVLPYFRKSERFAGGADHFRGDEGPIDVGPLPIDHTLTAAFVESAVEAGHERVNDYNGSESLGVGTTQVNQRRGFRHGAADAYLGPASSRSNLTVLTGATVDRIVIEDGRAVGVEYRDSNEHKVRVLARREVVVSAGAIGSPKLLLLSGIGPAADLQALGVPVLVDQPAVGRGLKEHPAFPMTFAVRLKTLNEEVTPLGVIRHGLDFVFRGRGAMASTACHALVFARLAGQPTASASSQPAIQLIFQPYGVTGSPTKAGGDNHADADADAPSSSMGPLGRLLRKLTSRRGGDSDGRQFATSSVVTVQPVLLHPRANGTVSLRSANPNDSPAITHDLGDSSDVGDLIAAGRAVREIFAAEPLKLLTTAEQSPGAAIATDAEWDEYIRSATFRMSHPTSTCAMGPGPDAVVDTSLRVRGVQGLRVVDASVMPTTVSGNTQAPTIMIAERAADLIISRE